MLRIGILLIAMTGLSAADADPNEGVPIMSMVNDGGIVAYTIILVSIVCITLALQLYLRLRQEHQSIEDLRERYGHRHALNDQGALLHWSQENPSLMASTVRAGVEASDEHREVAIQEEAAHYSGDLFRRADYLLFIGNTAPMLGLLGTVFGMMTSFNVLAVQGGVSDPGELAGGISGALVTTCMGLIVALPALIFYTMLRNRIELLVADVGRCIESLLFPERKKAQVTKPEVAPKSEVKPVSTGSAPAAPVKKVFMPEANPEPGNNTSEEDNPA